MWNITIVCPSKGCEYRDVFVCLVAEICDMESKSKNGKFNLFMAVFISSYLTQYFTSSAQLTEFGLVTPHADIDLGYIGSGNGLAPDATKPLPEPMLTYYQRHSVAFTWILFHWNRYQSLICD